MLTYFEIENFLSFASGEDCGFDLCGENKDFPPTNVAIIFGNNASGKTNLIKAFEFFREIFSLSQSNFASHYLFFANNEEQHIRLKCEIILDGNIYWYENTLTMQHDILNIFESINESLTVIPYKKADQEKLLFQSENSPQPAQHLLSYLVHAQLTDKDNQQELKQFLNYVKTIKIVSKPFETYLTEVANHLVQDVELKQSLITMLSQFDLHIAQVSEKRHKFLKEQVQIQFHHQDLGKMLPLKYESNGTLGLYVLLYFILLTLRDDGLLLVDQIETAIHPDIVELMIHIIKKTRLKKKYRYPQFIFTTHQIELMTLLESKRAIFLLEKNNQGATQIHNAEDFVDIGSVKDVYKQYRLGYLGAVPFLTEQLEDLAERLRKEL